MKDAPRKKRILTTKTTTSTTKIAAVAIVAAGSSQRMGALGKKEYLPLNGGSVLSEAALVFLKTKLFSTLLVVYPKGELAATKAALFKNPLVQELSQDTNVIYVPGGETRQQSVFNALKALQKFCARSKPPRLVLIHDGARPFLSQSLVKKTVQAALKYGAAVPALQPVETQKEMDSNSKITRHLKRSSLAAVQTPQGFWFPEIFDCHKKAAAVVRRDKSKAFTDDTEIWDNYSDKKTRVIKGEPQNIKITYPADLGSKNLDAPIFRVGLGTDLHRLVSGRKLILGGVHIPYALGEDGHSDGDALLHAITDAVLGAAALGDIGSYFPPEDPKWKGADSAKLLQAAWNDVKADGWQLQNLDCVVHLQEPKFLPHRQKVRESIARILGVNVDKVFVKAKTCERIGPVGLCQAVETKAICLLAK